MYCLYYTKTWKIYRHNNLCPRCKNTFKTLEKGKSVIISLVLEPQKTIATLFWYFLGQKIHFCHYFYDSGSNKNVGWYVKFELSGLTRIYCGFIFPITQGLKASKSEIWRQTSQKWKHCKAWNTNIMLILVPYEARYNWSTAVIGFVKNYFCTILFTHILVRHLVI